ncbi:cellulase family glycosylhydrolase [Mycolicibacterium sp. 050158]|uniref:cellulase family glycosylhydrolase n=1 Tax=Mycolicibacterium sp. 050158 TaxID=3090602 RepID=UPI00299DE73B|nr:cellulase family glycosylhydrolase [Mycolicibacterium sp. 050158]MDX1890696.1 cellulase family glycosylhydrolase [Mycolicibacterium sp. 050158]
MTKSNAKWGRRIATRGIVAALPAAMVVAYASNLFAPLPPRLASYQYVETAEIVDSPSTVGVADSNLYGMTDEQIATELDQLQSLGVTDIRVFVPWGLVETADDTYNWSYIDSITKAAAERNMGVMMEVNATPTWAAADPSGGNFPVGSATPNVADFTDFMKTLATRYGDTVSAYEIWNEPNYLGFSNPIDPTAYADLLKSVYPVLKEIDPTATVVAGALGTVQDTALTMSAVTFVQKMLDAGAGAYFDAISVHPYQDSLLFSDGYNCDCGGQLTPLQEIDAIKTLIGTDKTVWITEYGLSTVNGSTDEAKQAEYIKDLLDYWQTYSQAGPIFLYTGSDTATGSTDPEANYGLFYQDGDPKQAAEMLAAWIASHTTGSTDPGGSTGGNQTNPLVQAVQSLLNGITGTIWQAVHSVSVFAQAIVTAITNVITNLRTALASITGTSTTANTALVASTTAATSTASDSTESTAAKATTSKVVEAAVVSGSEATADTATTTSVDAGSATTSSATSSKDAETPTTSAAAESADGTSAAATSAAATSTAVPTSTATSAAATSTAVPTSTATSTAAKADESTSDSTTPSATTSGSTTKDATSSSSSTTKSTSTSGTSSDSTGSSSSSSGTTTTGSSSASTTQKETTQKETTQKETADASTKHLVGATSSSSSSSASSSSSDGHESSGGA